MDIKKNSKKRFYVALLLGVFSLFTITYTVDSIRNVSDKLASINKAKNSLESSEDMKINNKISSNYQLSEDKVKESTNKYNDSSESKEVINVDDTKKAKEVNNSISEKNKSVSKLTFNEEVGLKWPVNGEVAKNYSMDKLIYFPTLGVFKANPALFISAQEGTNVKCAYKGKVTKVGENKEVGKYVEIDIGNEYKILYGQLDSVQVKEGDNVEEDRVIAKVAKVSSYYAKEGNHLYFMVTQNNEAVDPMLLLR